MQPQRKRAFHFWTDMSFSRTAPLDQIDRNQSPALLRLVVDFFIDVSEQ